MNKTLLLFALFAILSFDIKNDLHLTFDKVSPEEAYIGILNNLDPLHPGRGIDTFNEKELDRPMAYGLILSAESNKYKYTKDSKTLDRIRICGEWLIRNSDLNTNGIHGYGLPDPWDAFGDKTVNPADQEYTIDTAVAIKGLLDWYDVEPKRRKKKEIYNTVFRVLEPFLTNKYDSPLGIPGYSLNPNDKEKDVFNPAVYLADQLRRFATLTSNDSLKTNLNIKSKKIFEILFSYTQTDSNGNIYWNYGTYIDSANDLVHACYMIEGIRSYFKDEGNAGVTWNHIVDHLNLFYSNNKWYRYFEKDRQTDKQSPRLWSLGMLMYSLSREGKYDKVDQVLWPQIQDYYLGGGHFKFRIDDDRKLVTHYGHLLLGLSYYLYNEKSFPPKK
ncbi:hypothetical protein SAMN04487891_101541 [Flagellimonas taeanensis]|uniref:Uncharacterized protein n=1 Tax=Flagellimonas taeanensis TaxID=1005926 RepID=A0A1M6QDC6_9FLAO|nr:hypothetical protein [Allomuricauda taeanensis]SFB70254.1 hypothetical protein SAMN04487891_101541 [Allomuricauda taeanensis]SHK18063.1 hypothetical protein SAMN05216293_0548 [Allomuricauda taeanensis]